MDSFSLAAEHGQQFHWPLASGAEPMGDCRVEFSGLTRFEREILFPEE